MKKVILTIALFTFLFNSDLFSQWVRSNGLYGGLIRCLLFKGNTLFAGTESNGVLLSVDNGKNWSLANIGIENANVSVLAQAQSGTGDTILFAGTWGGGVFRSTDGGRNWSAVNTGLTNSYVYALVALDTFLFAGTRSGGVFRSINNGVNWEAANQGLRSNRVFTFAVYPNGIDGKIILAGTAYGIQISTDNGASWRYLGLSSENITSLAVIPDQSGNTNILAGSTTDWNGGFVFRSTDNGAGWSAANSGMANVPVKSLVAMTNLTGGVNLFAGTFGAGIYLTTDNGMSWKSLNTGIVNPFVMTLNANQTGLFAGTASGGVYLSANYGTSWTSINTGFGGRAYTFLSIDEIQEGNRLFVGTDNGVFVSDNNGNCWSGVCPGRQEYHPLSLAIIPRDTIGLDLFTGTLGQGVIHSINDGDTWAVADTGLKNLSIRALAVQGKNLFAGTNGGVFLTTDNGRIWNSVNEGLLSTDVRSLAAIGINIYAGFQDIGVFKSSNNGSNWTSANTGLTNLNVNVIVAGPKGPFSSNLYLGTENGVFVTANEGIYWSTLGKNFAYVEAIALSNNEMGEPNIFAYNSGRGVFLSSNSGANWIAVNTTGITDYSVYDLAVSDTNLFLADAYGVSRIRLTDIISKNSSRSEVPTDFVLSQNFPNPFNSSTKITFGLPRKAFASLKIYDVLAREVATLVSGELPEGTYDHIWNTGNIASGIYFCCLRAESSVKTKKFIVIK